MPDQFYNIYLNCPLCGQLYSAISYPKYEDGMVICTCTAESVHNERSKRQTVHNERRSLFSGLPLNCARPQAQKLALMRYLRQKDR